jgi:acyl-CoA hydrolase
MKNATSTPAASDRSPVIMTELVLPSHTNALGTIFGGVVVGWVDIACAIAAQRYARSACVTVSIDYLHFKAPIRLGHTVHIRAEVTWAGRTSMEIEATVIAENSTTGEKHQATQAFLTFVALDENRKPKAVPVFVAKTEAEKKKFSDAERRRALRLNFDKGL